MDNSIQIRNNKGNNGMTTPEFILAVIMLSSFTGVFVLVTQFIASFFSTIK